MLAWPFQWTAWCSYVRAIEAVGIDRRDPVYWAGRAVLIHRHEDIATYDRIFDSFWFGGSRGRIL